MLSFCLWLSGLHLSLAADLSANEVQAEIEANKNNLTALRTITAPPWVSAPEYRGTTSILWSCAITLIACIYTALHLDIPREKGAIAVLAQKVQWVLIALLVPEMVLYKAFSQFFQAFSLRSKLSREVSKVLQSQTASEALSNNTSRRSMI